jgi:hypothetical protein
MKGPYTIPILGALIVLVLLGLNHFNDSVWNRRGASLISTGFRPNLDPGPNTPPYVTAGEDSGSLAKSPDIRGKV